jgi:hypothetical protein
MVLIDEVREEVTGYNPAEMTPTATTAVDEMKKKTIRQLDIQLKSIM